MKRTQIFAHRGANKEAAENTRTAFDKALRYAIDGIETDIQLTRDEETVLWHDDDLAKLGLPGKRIDDLDCAQLQAMDFASHFAGADKEGVMLLDDFVASYRARCRLLLEIKRYPGEPDARQHIKVRESLALVGVPDAERILASSFDLDSMLYARHIAPQLPLVFNLEPEHDAAFAQRVLDEHAFLYGLCVHISTLDEAMMNVVRERGKSITVYTCNTEEQIGRALTLGVDILISDYPHKALQMREKQS
ncbi:MAG: glycerophosphodiester phosphodiesterase [Sideroxydans sp.]